MKLCHLGFFMDNRNLVSFGEMRLLPLKIGIYDPRMRTTFPLFPKIRCGLKIN